MMNEKFPYGYDVNAYIDKALERMKETYFWATKEMLNPEWTYAIEQDEDGEYQYVTYYDPGSDEKFRTVWKEWDYEGFLKHYIHMNGGTAERYNPVKESFFVRPARISSAGWDLEIYKIEKRELGGFSVYIQAGNRTAGASKSFYIPVDYFKLPWEEFLDKYFELAPPSSFYVNKADLENASGLKEFLGF